MQNFTKEDNFKASDPDVLDTKMQRRSFFRYAGAGAAALTVFAAACKKGSTDATLSTKTAVDVGSGDNGILNLGYAIAQLQAAFYIQVIATPYTGITAGETSLLTDLRDHEVAHREFYKALLAANAKAALTPDFSSVNFADRTNVLSVAKGLEDISVATYNGVAYLVTDPNNLGMLGKIVSVEARHSAVARNMLGSSSFATFADTTIIHPASLQTSSSATTPDPYFGLEAWRPVSAALPVINQYLTVNLTATTLP